MAVAHRVAVVGGGVGGSVCAALLRHSGLPVTLFDKGRRPGGRAAMRRVRLKEAGGGAGDAGAGVELRFDTGAQFVRATDARFKLLLESPLMAGLVEEWRGRFGVLGSLGGELLPRDDILTLGMFRSRPPSSQPDADEEAAAAAAAAAAAKEREMAESPINYCGFLEGSSSDRLYTGADGVGSFAPGMLRRCGVAVERETEVTGLSLEGRSAGSRGKWALRTACGTEHEPFDSVVLANHDPALAAGVLEGLQASAPDPELSQPPAAEVIERFVGRLRGLRAARSCRYSLLLAFPRPLTELPFDAASVHGSELQFLSRDSSKPGRGSGGPECWVAQSTAAFAAAIDGELGPAGVAGGSEAARAEATARMRAALERLLGKFFEGQALPEALHAEALRWGSGFFTETLALNGPGETHNDAVTFAPWRLALCGDYLGARQGVQEAALSGMMAADRVAQWAAMDSRP